MIKKWSQFNEGASEHKDVILYGRVNLRDKCLTALIGAIDNAFVEVHELYNTVSGDADFTSENLLNSDAVSTMERQVSMNMNLESVFKSVKTDKVNMDVLKELDDERMSCVEGDYVICIINNPYLEIVLTKVRSGKDGLYIMSSGGEGHIFEDTYKNGALLVVKKETYDDFAGSHRH